MAKNSKNLQKVQDMVDGNYKSKVQVGYGDQQVEQHEIGDIWTDSDDIKWEQKKGYRVRISNLPKRGIADKCSDCKSFILKKWDKDSFRWNGRCYYCQIDYEAQYSRKLGGDNKQENSEYGKYKEERFKNFKTGYIEKWEEENKEFVKELDKLENPFDKTVANAMANENVDMTIKKNKG
jgi:hypothetical protein